MATHFGEPGITEVTGLGIYVGTSEPTLKTYAQWLSSKTGYWAWIDISNEIGGVSVTLVNANSDASVTPLVSTYSRYVTATINPATALGDITALVSIVAGIVNAEVKSAHSDGVSNPLPAAYVRYITGTVNSANASAMITALISAYKVAAVVGAGTSLGATTVLAATASGGGITSFTDPFTGTNGNSIELSSRNVTIGGSSVTADNLWNAPVHVGAGIGSATIQSNKGQISSSGGTSTSITTKTLTFATNKTIVMNAAPGAEAVGSHRLIIHSGSNSIYLGNDNVFLDPDTYYAFSLYTSDDVRRIDGTVPSSDTGGTTYVDWKLKFLSATSVQLFLGTTSCGTYTLPFTMGDFTIEVFTSTGSTIADTLSYN